MERAKKVGVFWNWLPTFRVAAETEHLGRAAGMLGVSAPAVTRTISLLEEELGVELLAREGRGVRLTEAGHLLQGAVRDAMRTIHEASLRFEQSGFGGSLRVACASPAQSTLLHPAVRLLAERHPELSVEACNHPSRDVRGALLRGELDVAILRSDIKPDGVSVERLGSIPTRLYAPPCLNLVARRVYRLEELSAFSFIALSETYGSDPFPASVARKIVLVAESFEHAERAAIELGALVVLPRSLGDRAESTGALVRVKTPALRPLSLSIAWRTSLALKTSADVFVDTVRELACEMS